MIRHHHHQYKCLPPNLKLFLTGHALMAFGNSIYSLLFNLFLSESGYREGAMGSLAAMTSLGTALMAFPSAFILERFSVKPLLIIGLVISALSYITQIFSGSMDTYTILGLLGAMGLAIFNVSVAPFIFRHATAEQRMHAFILNSATVMGAQILGYSLGGRLPEILQALIPSLNVLSSYQWAMTMALGVSLLALVPYLKIIRVPVPKNRMSFRNVVSDKDWKTLGKLIVPKALIAFGAGMIIPFMNVYLSNRFQLTSGGVGLCFGVMQLFVFMGIFISPLITKKMDRINFMMGTALLSVPFMLTMAFTSSIVLVIGSFFLRGMLMNMSSPITSLFEMERVKEKECLFASSMLIFCYNLSWTFSTQLGGRFIEAYGFKSSFLIASSFYLSAVVAYWYFFKRKNTAGVIKIAVPDTNVDAA